MALLWLDGFEQYENTADVLDTYTTSQSASTTIETGRNTGAGNNKALQLGFNTTNMSARLTETTSTVVVGFAFKAVLMTTLDIIRLYSDSTEMITLRISTGEIYIDRGSTNLGSTTTANLLSNMWYYFELKVFIHDSTGTVQVWVDGVSKLSLTSQDTKNGTPTTINGLYLGGASSDFVYDDLYLLDDSGTDATDVLGDCRVETVFPDADGATNNFTAVGAGTTNADRVDDGSTPDDDTTYVHSSTATNKDLYGFAALAGDIDTVYAVGVALRVRKTEAGFRTVATVARSNVTEVDGSDYAIGVDWRYVNEIYENDPDGGGAWDEAAVNAAQFGIKITG